jgi:hypothetical protein
LLPPVRRAIAVIAHGQGAPAVRCMAGIPGLAPQAAADWPDRNYLERRILNGARVRIGYAD